MILILIFKTIINEWMPHSKHLVCLSCWIPKDQFDNYFEKKFIYLFKNMTYFDIND